MIFEVQYLIIYCIDKTIFTNVCIFETAKLILLNAQNLVPMNIIENTVCCIHMYIDSVKFNLISFLTLILEFFFEFFSPSLLSLHRCQLEMVTAQDLKTSQRLHEGKLSLEAE